jgi:hypothetical protein
MSLREALGRGYVRREIRRNQIRGQKDPRQRLLELSIELSELFTLFWMRPLSYEDLLSLVRKLFPGRSAEEQNAKARALALSLFDTSGDNPVNFILLINTVFPEAGDCGNLVRVLHAKLAYCAQSETVTWDCEAAFDTIAHCLILFTAGKAFHDFQTWVMFLFPRSFTKAWFVLKSCADQFLRLKPTRGGWNATRKFFSMQAGAGCSRGDLTPVEVLRAFIENTQNIERRPTPSFLSNVTTSFFHNSLEMSTGPILEINRTVLYSTRSEINTHLSTTPEPTISHSGSLTPDDPMKARRDSVMSTLGPEQ